MVRGARYGPSVEASDSREFGHGRLPLPAFLVPLMVFCPNVEQAPDDDRGRKDEGHSDDPRSAVGIRHGSRVALVAPSSWSHPPYAQRVPPLKQGTQWQNARLAERH